MLAECDMINERTISEWNSATGLSGSAVYKLLAL